MALHYHTEYRLGNRGRICRSYTGFQAFLAIGLDLVFGLLFELVFLSFGLAMRIAVLSARFVVRVLRINWQILVAAMTLVVYVATLPFVWIHQAVDRLRSRGKDERTDPWRRPDAVVKPTWAMSREV
jgi:branched-subunit amino acid ABC-type transport system permease component